MSQSQEVATIMLIAMLVFTLFMSIGDGDGR